MDRIMLAVLIYMIETLCLYEQQLGTQMAFVSHL